MGATETCNIAGAAVTNNAVTSVCVTTASSLANRAVGDASKICIGNGAADVCLATETCNAGGTDSTTNNAASSVCVTTTAVLANLAVDTNAAKICIGNGAADVCLATETCNAGGTDASTNNAAASVCVTSTLLATNDEIQASNTTKICIGDSYAEACPSLYQCLTGGTDSPTTCKSPACIIADNSTISCSRANTSAIYDGCTCGISANATICGGPNHVDGTCYRNGSLYTHAESSCAIPSNISTLINNANHSDCGLILAAGSNCTVARASGFIPAGVLECGSSMGRLSKRVACIENGTETQETTYVNSKLMLALDMNSSATVQTDAFKEVIQISIANSSNSSKSSVEILVVSVIVRRQLVSSRRRLAAVSVNVDFRIKAIDNVQQLSLLEKTGTNKAAFVTSMTADIVATSAKKGIPMNVTSVAVSLPTVEIVTEPKSTTTTTPAPSAAHLSSVGVTIIGLLGVLFV